MDLATRTYTALVADVIASNDRRIEIGAKLHYLKTDDNWRQAVGEGGIDNWDDFLKQPEIGLSRLEADRLIKIYQTFFTTDKFNHYSQEQIMSIPFKNLVKLTELDEITDDVIEQAMFLTDRDFKEVLAENKNVTARTYTYMVMRKCKETGNMTKVHGITSEEVKDKFNINE